MNIDDMPAGREMDALVAEKVMAWTSVRTGKKYDASDFDDLYGQSLGGFDWRCPVPGYSTDIAAAWKVVEYLRKRKEPYGAQLDHIEERNQSEGIWVVQFCAKYNEAWWHAHAYADTVPLAICRAALKAVL